MKGFLYGFDIGASPVQARTAFRNCVLAFQMLEIIDAYLKEEMQFGAIAGPFQSSPIEGLIINRFGVIPKTTPGKWRLITDLSYPHGESVNDLIADEEAAVCYEGIPNAISNIMRLGKAAFMAKFDLRRAYRILPVREMDRKFLGMKWRHQYYIDLAIPFGSRSAPRIFTRFADVVQDIFAQVLGPNVHIQHYLDDFFLVGLPGTDDCHKALSACLTLCDQLGVPVAPEKTEGPSTCITFLGLTLDSDKPELRIPEEKLSCIRNKLDFWSHRRVGLKRELLSLIGLLQYCCQPVSFGRPFLRRLIDRSTTVAKLPWSKGERIACSC